jgi:acetylornithine deacetylase/succinyl-diaminopimelate desuccinylase-like protein
VEGDILWGRGVMDDKAGVLIMLNLIKELKDLPVSYVFFVDEEEEGTGSKKYAEKYAHDFAITMEPTSLRVCTAEAGSLELEFEFWGRAMHGSCAKEEENAIWEGVKFLNSLKKMKFLKAEHPLLGSPAINVEMFDSGDYLLAVPDSAKVLVDFIYMPGQTAVEIIDEVNRIGKRFNMNHMIYDLSPPFEISPNKRKVKQFLKYAEVGGFRSWSDAQNLVNKGTPTVVFGPGNLRDAHTKDEHVSIEEVNQAYRILKSVLHDWSV